MEFVLNDYKTIKKKSKYLVTTAHGGWLVLTKKEFFALQQEKIEGNLLKKLEMEGIIVTEKNANSIAKRYRDRNSMLFRGASLHIIVPTLRCNMKCVYCHASSKSINEKGYDMDRKTAKKVVDFIFQSPSPCLSIEFQGGEPLVNFPTIKYIITYAQKKNEKLNRDLIISLVTNLSIMDEEKLEFLASHNVSICTSLDGPKSIHDKNRKYTKGSNYEQVAYWLKRIKEAYAKRGLSNNPEALITLTRIALKNPKMVIDEYAKNKLENIHIRFLNQLGAAKASWKNISYTPEEYLQFWKKSIEYIIKLNQKGIPIQERIVKVILQKLLTDKDPNYLEMKSPCGAAIGQIVYNFNGDIYSCDEGRMIGEDLFKLGNANKDDYKSVTTSEQACTLITSSINEPFCNNCIFQPYCGICPVCNYSEQGSIIAKIPQTSRCKIYKGQFSYIFDKLIFDKKKSKILKRWLKTE